MIFQIQKVLLIATKSNVWFETLKILFILRTTPFYDILAKVMKYEQ